MRKLIYFSAVQMNTKVGLHHPPAHHPPHKLSELNTKAKHNCLVLFPVCIFMSHLVVLSFFTVLKLV